MEALRASNRLEFVDLADPLARMHAILSCISDQTSRFDTLTAYAQRAINLLKELPPR